MEEARHEGLDVEESSSRKRKERPDQEKNTAEGEKEQNMETKKHKANKDAGASGPAEKISKRRQRREKQNNQSRDQKPYEQTQRKNKLYCKYYREMPFLALEEGSSAKAEWKKLCDCLKSDLPTTFRVNENSSFFPMITERLTKYSKQVESDALEFDNSRVAFSPLSWAPSAWYLNVSRRHLRKAVILKELNQFVVANSDVGNITRQEAVSMIPPLLLDVKPEHRVLDMCAAPGSKTCQLISFLHQGTSAASLPSGVVLANDVDKKRCYMLAHQLLKLNSPCFLVANSAAQGFPIIKLVEQSESPVLTDVSDEEKYLLFDRVLCDVPCSGDGTLRKNFDIWGKWNPYGGICMHLLQLKIATRAAKVLKVGGRMVYSTCSLNPVEDEAVVSALLERSQGALILVDVSDELKGLKRTPGISKWRIMDEKEELKDNKKEYAWYDSHQELPPIRQGKVAATCFPPASASSLHLERCMRILPHHQDTGGFFVAVLQKVAQMPEGKAEEEVQVETAVPENTDPMPPEPEKPQNPKRKKKAKKEPKEDDPFQPLSEEVKKQYEILREFYGIREDFPSHLLMTRGVVATKIYFVSPTVQQIVSSGLSGLQNTGVRIFVKHAPPGALCQYRLSQEGITFLLPYLQKRVVRINKEELRMLLLNPSPPPLFTSFSEGPRKALDGLTVGCCVFVVEDIPHPENTTPVAVCGWRSNVSAHLLMDKMQVAAFKALFV